MSQLRRLLTPSISKFLSPTLHPHITLSKRTASNARRFYKSVSVAGTHGSYEVNLDHRKLKTPLRNVLQVPSYPLALAIAHEWENVKEEIVPSFMHITGLTYTVVDNPNQCTKMDLANSFLEFLETDTMLFADENSEEFSKKQAEEWWPILDWFNARYGVNIKPSLGIQPAEVSVEELASLRRQILSYNDWTVAGLLFSCEAVKSVILTLAAMERKISCAKAVELSRLEVDHQASHWGRVEWAHDMEHTDSEARFCAGLLFAQLNSAQQHRTIKKDDWSAQHI